MVTSIGVFNDVKEWSDNSLKGNNCGILGCERDVEWKCPTCGHFYCERHKEMHQYVPCGEIEYES